MSFVSRHRISFALIPALALMVATTACAPTPPPITPTLTFGPPTATTEPPTLAPTLAPTTAPTTAPTATVEPTQVPPTTAATTETQPTATAAAPVLNLGEFRQKIFDTVINDRQASGLFTLMGETFSIQKWPAAAETFPSPQAATIVQVDYLPQTGDITYDWGMDLSPKLGGTDPLSLWGDEVNAVDVSIMLGWGRDGKGEALIIIAEKPEVGGYYWHAVIFDPDGF